MNRCLHKSSRLHRPRLLGAFFICLSLYFGMLGASEEAVAEEQGPTVSLMVNGKGVFSDVQPQNENGRMLVPIRFIAEATGAKVSYDAESKQVTLEQKGRRVSLIVGKNIAYVNGKHYTLDVPPKIVSNRTLIPIRFVSEALGYRVYWDQIARVAQIESQEPDDSVAVVETGTNPYVVQVGDTLSEIASKHGTTISAIKKNNFLSSDNLTIDQILFLPNGSRKALNPLSKKVGDSKLLGSSYYFPFNDRSWYEPYGDSFGSDREWTESNSGSVRSHEGIDIMAPKGTPVFSVSTGTINRIGWNTYGGWRINITDAAGQYRMYYAHLSAYAPGLRIGDSIQAGQLIGFVGDTGYGGAGTVGMFAPHLHFGLYRNDDGRAIDAYDYLRYWEQNKIASPFS